MTKRKFKKIRSMTILGIKHKVRYITPEPGDGGYYSEGLIEIDKNVDYDEYLKTLIHEGLHGVFEITGIHQDISLPQEHTIIESTIAFLSSNFDITLKEK